MHCLVSESSVQCAFLELWTYLDKSLLQSKFFQHLIFYVHCTLCRIKVAIAMEWEKISDLRPAWVAIWTLWPRWLWLAMSLCSGAIWTRWRFVAFVAQFFHIANFLSRLRTSESEPRRQSEHSELRWCLGLLRCNDRLRRVWIADCSDMPLNLRGRVLKRAPAVMHVGIFKLCSRIWVEDKWTWVEKPEPHIEMNHFYSNTMSPIALPSRVQAPVAARPFAKAETCILVLSR